jgi:hypothetical protein
VPNIKSLLMAAAVSAGVALAMPTAGEAMPTAAPVKMQAATDGSLVQVHYKKKWRKKHWHRKHWRKSRWHESRRWRHHHHRWARYCDPWDGCYPYGGYGYPYYGGFYGPGFYGPGIGLYFRID